MLFNSELSLFSSEIPTCDAGKVAVNVVDVVVLDALFSVGAEGNCGGMKTGHAMKQPQGGVAPYCAKLYSRIKRLCCDYGSWHAAKIGQLLYHLSV